MGKSQSQQSILNATRSRVKFSGHGNAKGAAGYVDPNGKGAGEFGFLAHSGEYQFIDRPEGGFDEIVIGAAWDNMMVPDETFWGKLLKRKKPADIDLDLGCLYELENGKRGAIQAFGSLFGAKNEPPYMQLSGDERTGEKEGFDESISVNGAHWNDIARVLIYVYIYEGALDWAQVKPQIHLRVPGQRPLIVTLETHHKHLSLCAIAGIENIRGSIKLTNHTEYFPGHAEMDRAFGFGLEWDDGDKE